ncbi:MAG: cytochrome C [Deltaproteobacteria bacterium RIFOXYD12_FULL_56_24]|nr:MAG: cytochrome C [Deltaproteobacteria bacterium RIFOXYD12_FULL_56_24]
MKEKAAFQRIVTAGLLGTFLVSASSMTWANGPTEVKPLALHKIMQDLAADMQAVTDGISREDWALVAKIAPRIADHPQPPLTEKMRILSFIGSDAGKFKGHEEKNHQAGLELKRAAGHQDRPAVISAFATLQNGCLACHQSFRKSFQEHFYEQR